MSQPPLPVMRIQCKENDGNSFHKFAKTLLHLSHRTRMSRKRDKAAGKGVAVCIEFRRGCHLLSVHNDFGVLTHERDYPSEVHVCVVLNRGGLIGMGDRNIATEHRDVLNGRLACSALQTRTSGYLLFAERRLQTHCSAHDTLNHAERDLGILRTIHPRDGDEMAVGLVKIAIFI